MMQPNPASEPEFAAFVAIDWADKEHAWSLEVLGSSRRETGKLKQTPEAIEAWAVSLAQRFAGRPIAVGLEQTRGALIYALGQYRHLVLYPISPLQSSRYRGAMFPSGSKDDPKDADLLLDLLVRHRDRFRPLKPNDEPTRKLQMLVEKRRQLVDQRTAQTNRITDLLKLYFPQVLDGFDDLGAPLLRAALQRWPTLEQWQAEDPEVLRTFFHQHHSRSQTRIQERLDQIRQARPALADAAVTEPAALTVQGLLDTVAALREAIASLDRRIQQVAASHPDFPIFDSFPGAGPALAPRLLAAFGSERDRFRDAHEVATFSGIAPVISRSGETQCWIHFRWACPKFLRQTFHEYAEHSIAQSAWARAFYDQQRSKQKSHHAAVRSLALKWIRILFRCWQARTPYREEVYVAAQAQRRPQPAAPSQPGAQRAGRPAESGGDSRPAPSPAAAPLPPRPKGAGRPTESEAKPDGAVLLLPGLNLALGWKKVGDFWKICAVIP